MSWDNRCEITLVEIHFLHTWWRAVKTLEHLTGKKNPDILLSWTTLNSFSVLSLLVWPVKCFLSYLCWMFFFVSLQIGDFLRIYNLRAIPGSSKVPGLTSSQSDQVDHLAFHLHGGTAYGRGIRVLPENSPDVQELKRYGSRRGSNTPDVCGHILEKIFLGDLKPCCNIKRCTIWIQGFKFSRSITFSSEVKILSKSSAVTDSCIHCVCLS